MSVLNILRSEEYHVLKCYCFVILSLHREDTKFLSIKLQFTYLFKFLLLIKEQWN